MSNMHNNYHRQGDQTHQANGTESWAGSVAESPWIYDFKGDQNGCKCVANKIWT